MWGVEAAWVEDYAVDRSGLEEWCCCCCVRYAVVVVIVVVVIEDLVASLDLSDVVFK